MLPFLKGSSSNNHIDNEGIITTNINIVNKGKAANIISDLQFGTYLDTEITGKCHNIKVEQGSMKESDYKKQPYLEAVEFSDFGCLVKGRTSLITRNTYIIALLITALYLVTIPSFGYYGAAVALMLAQATQFFLAHWTSKHLYDTKISLKPLMLLLVLATIGYWIANHWFAQENIWLDLSLKLFVPLFC